MAKSKLIKWINLTYPEIDELDKNKVVIIVVGAIEAHGHHLPLATDLYCPKVIANDVCTITGSIYGPEIQFGLSSMLMKFPGTITLRTQTFINLMEDIVTSIASHGFKRFLFLNGHGSNTPGILTAFNEIGSNNNELILRTTNWIHNSYLKELNNPEYEGIHADKAETEMVMQYDSSLVDMKKAKDFTDYKHRWQVYESDLSRFLPFAVAGSPTKANKKDSEKLRNHVVNKIVELVQKIEKIKL